MGKSDYQSRRWAAQMKIWEKYKVLNTKMLTRIAEEGATLNRHVAAMEMQRRGGDDIIAYAVNLCLNKNYTLREIGAFILGQVAIPDSQMLLKAIKILALLGEADKSIRVRYAAIYSLGHRCAKGFTNYELIVPILKKSANAPIASVREAIAFSLAYILSPDAAPLLEKLLLDSDKDVRNWAAFAVNNSEADDANIRKALVKMLHDPFDEAKLEAISALASRQDKRVVPALKHELEQEILVLTVVEATADLGVPDFIPLLKKLLDKFDDEEGVIQRAIDKLKKSVE